jgi:chromate transporter
MGTLAWQLFIIFLKVSALSFGGGASAIPLMQRELVGGALMTPQDFSEALALSTSVPGLVSSNMAVFVSYKLGGSAFTAVAAVAGSILPAVLLMGSATYLLMKFKDLKALQAMLKAIQPLNVALLATTVIGIVPVNVVSPYQWALFAGSVLLMGKFNVHPGWVVLGAAALGVFMHEYG